MWGRGVSREKKLKRVLQTSLELESRFSARCTNSSLIYSKGFFLGGRVKVVKLLPGRLVNYVTK